MALYEAGGQLSKGLRQLLNLWDEVRMGWDDAQAHEFEEKYLVPLQNDLSSAIRAMAHMSTLVEKIRRECE